MAIHHKIIRFEISSTYGMGYRVLMTFVRIKISVIYRRTPRLQLNLDKQSFANKENTGHMYKHKMVLLAAEATLLNILFFYRCGCALKREFTLRKAK